MTTLTQRKKRNRLRVRHQPSPVPAAAPEPSSPPAFAPVAALHTRRARWIYWGLFAFAVIAFAQMDGIFGLTKALHGAKPAPVAHWTALCTGVSWLVLLIASLFALGLFVYEGERAHGRIRRQVRIYERILARWEGRES